MSNHLKKQLIKAIDSHGYSMGRREAYTVFIAYSLSRLNMAYILQSDQKRVNLLDNILKSSDYTNEELSNMFDLMVDALEENCEQDFLGEVYSELNLTSSQHGQFFTPYPISRMMAEINLSNVQENQTSPISIADPCCGTGGMLIATGNVLKSRGYKLQDYMFYAQDIDWLVSMSAYVQMSLQGLQGMVVVGNSLDNGTVPSKIIDEDNVWITSPTYIYHPELVIGLKVKNKQNNKDKIVGDRSL